MSQAARDVSEAMTELGQLRAAVAEVLTIHRACCPSGDGCHCVACGYSAVWPCVTARACGVRS